MTDSVFITPNMPVRNFGCRGCVHEVSLPNPLQISTLATRPTPNETQPLFKVTARFSAKDSLQPIPTRVMQEFLREQNRLDREFPSVPA